MHALYDLKNMLCKELEEYGKQKKLTAGTLDVVDKLTHTIKNLNKVIEKGEEDEYSNAYDGGSYDGSYDGMSNASYARNMSYARGRGRGARRDSMGRYASESGYSRNDDMVAELHNLMEDVTDERKKMELKKFIDKIQSM